MLRTIALDATEVCGHYLDDRFERLLVEVWKSLPVADRKLINAYWNDSKNHHQLDGPIIALVKGPVNNVGNGATSLIGFMLRFVRGYVEQVSDDYVKDLIAHELGHVFDFAETGESDPMVRVEWYANDRMTQWGYRMLPQTPRKYVPPART